MKKLLFFLVVLTTFTNVSYASFPVADTLKVKQDTLQTEKIIVIVSRAFRLYGILV